MIDDQTKYRISNLIDRGDITVIPHSAKRMPDGTWRQPYAYSVGMTRNAGLPEFLTVGLPAEKSRDLVLHACRWIFRNPARFPGVGQYLHGVTLGRPLLVAPLALADAARILHSANAYAAPGGIEACQLLWADPSGRYPGQDGVDAYYAGIQDPFPLAKALLMS